MTYNRLCFYLPSSSQPASLSRLLGRQVKLIVAFLLITTASFASGSEHAVGFSSIIYPLINFFIFFFVLSLILRKPLRQAWVARRESFLGRSEQANAELVKAQQALFQAEQANQQINTAIRDLKAEIEQHTKLELEELREAHLRRLDVLKKEVETKLLVSEKSLRNSLYESVVNEVVGQVTKRLGESYDDAQDYQRTQTALKSLDANGGLKLAQFYKESN